VRQQVVLQQLVLRVVDKLAGCWRVALTTAALAAAALQGAQHITN